jgi:hypothetical protein
MLTALLGACAPGKRATDGPEAGASVSAISVSSSGTSGVVSDEAWDGTYVSEAGSLYVVDGGEWRAVQWRGDDASTGLGEGVLSLTLQRGPGRVSGTGSGAIGDVVWVGVLDGDRLTANISRRDPLDRGLTGTAVGKVSPEQIVGTMRLSLADAHVIRNASFVLAQRKR